MGFLGRLGKGLVGAATGFATGGPMGAAAGGLAGLASGDSTSTQSSSSGGTQQMQLRDLSPEEQALQTGAYGTVASSRGLTPEQADALRQEEYDRVFGSSSRVINRSFNLAQDRGYAAAARRGLGGAGATGARADAREGERSFQLTQASADAEGQAQRAALLEQENRRASASAAMAQLNSVWANRTRGSKIITTGTATGSQTAPDDFAATAAAGLGSALTDESSYLNRSLLGGV